MYIETTHRKIAIYAISMIRLYKQSVTGDFGCKVKQAYYDSINNMVYKGLIDTFNIGKETVTIDGIEHSHKIII